MKPEQNSIEPEIAKGSPSQTKKVFIKTHGCQMNEYDSDRMLDLLKESQHAELVDDPEMQTYYCLIPALFARRRRRKCFTNWAAGAA